MNKLHLNSNKTVFIQFTPGINKINESALLKIKGKSLKQVQNVKLLGVCVENSLSWETHLTKLCSKVSTMCYAVYRLRRIAGIEIAMSYYYAEFQSRITYGIIFWGASTFVRRLFILQKLAVRNLAGVSKTTSCRPLFKSMKLLTLTSLYVLEIALYVRQNQNLFTKNNSYHKYNTRSNDSFSVPAHSLTAFEKSPLYMGVKIYNFLPSTLKNVKTDRLFKRELTSLLKTNAYYSLKEFFELKL